MEIRQERLFPDFIYKSFWQWAVIVAVNAAAVLNYTEAAPFLYSIYPMDAFEFILKCLFSDLIAFSERKGRNVPIVWWLLAFLFPPVTLFYLFFFPFDKEGQEGTRRKLDAGFAVACALSVAIPVLYSIWN